MRPHELTALMAAILATGREPGAITLEAAKMYVADAERILDAATPEPELLSVHRGKPLFESDPRD